MPELPEVEVVRRGLEREVAGRTVTAVAVTGARTVRRQAPGALVDRLRGATLGPAGRIGKFLLVPLDGGADTLVIHLRMSGQLLLTAPEWPLARHTHAVLRLSDGRELRFVDPRTFGELFVAPSPVAALAHLGPDPLSAGWSAAVLRRGLAGRRGRLKLLLMDQRFVAGIVHRPEHRFPEVPGVMEGPEGGFQALHHVAGPPDGGRLLLPEAASGHRVYGREGQPCLRCGAPVRRISLGGRSTFLCETCQR